MKKKNWLQILMSFAVICKGKMIAAVIFAIISVFGGIIPFFGVYRLLEEAIKECMTAQSIISFCCICAGGFLIQILSYGISTTFAHVSAYTILEQIRIKMAKRLMGAPLGEITTRSAGHLKDIFLDKVSTIELPLAHVIPEVGSSLLLPVVMFFYICAIDWRMALATLATLPICMLPMISKKSRKNFNEKYAAYMKANDHVNNVIVEYIEGIEIVKIFNQTASSYEKFAGAVRTFRDFTMEWYKSSWKNLTMMSSVLPSTLLVTLPLGLWLFIHSEISASELTICCILALGLITPLIKFTTYVNMGKSIEYAILSANELLSMPELEDSTVKEFPSKYDISLHNISFSYTDQDEILHGLDLVIPLSKITALVGPSGGGKSTVAKLIARFWDVNKGAIEIGGINIRNIPIAELSKIVSFVTQDNFLFNCSLKENIRMGKLDATDDEVLEAAKAARCEEFVSRLEQGFDTPAGEAGRFLSGGEKQRIALARAILKDAPIVILDEATAFTDPENEAKIQESILRLGKGKTLLVIAHRLSTIKNADKIVVLKNGTITGMGKHEDLLKSCSLYERLWKSHTGAKQWAVNTGGK